MKPGNRLSSHVLTRMREVARGRSLGPELGFLSSSVIVLGLYLVIGYRPLSYSYNLLEKENPEWIRQGLHPSSDPPIIGFGSFGGYLGDQSLILHI